MNETLEEQLRETYAERDARYDPAAAVERLRARDYRTRGRVLRLVDRSQTRVWRAALAGLVVVAVIAGAVSVIALDTGQRASLPGLSARQVIARTAAFVTGSGDGILHVAATTTNFVGNHASYTVDIWSEEKAPFDYRVSSTTLHEVKVDNTLLAYRSDFNQISVGNLRHGPVPVQVEDPLDTAIAEVDEVHGVGSLYRGETISATAFARALAKIIKGPGVTVNRNAAFRGAPAIRITSGNRRATLDVDPITYRPLELVTKIKVLGNDNKVVKSHTSTTIFETYETLPQSSLDGPNLVLSFPHAIVAPWERHYWKRYWSRVSSGSAQTRRQALGDLHNN